MPNIEVPDINMAKVKNDLPVIKLFQLVTPKLRPWVAFLRWAVYESRNFTNQHPTTSHV